MLYTVTKVMDGLTLTKDWTTLSLSGKHSGHLIGIKADSETVVTGAIDHTKVTKVVLERAVETGIDGSPAIIDTIELNFKDQVTTDKTVDKLVALEQFSGYPEDCYVRVKEIVIYDPSKSFFDRIKVYSIYNNDDLTKTCDIDINVAPLEFV